MAPRDPDQRPRDIGEPGENLADDEEDIDDASDDDSSSNEDDSGDQTVTTLNYFLICLLEDAH